MQQQFSRDQVRTPNVAQGSQLAVGASHIPSTPFVTFRQHRLWIIAMRMIPGRNHATGHGGRAYGQYLHVQASVVDVDVRVDVVHVDIDGDVVDVDVVEVHVQAVDVDVLFWRWPLCLLLCSWFAL